MTSLWIMIGFIAYFLFGLGIHLGSNKKTHSLLNEIIAAIILAIFWPFNLGAMIGQLMEKKLNE